MDKHKLLHVYFDEGGIFGTAEVLVTKKKLRTSKKEEDISHYYIGKMIPFAIQIMIKRFKLLYPDCETKVKGIDQLPPVADK